MEDSDGDDLSLDGSLWDASDDKLDSSSDLEREWKRRHDQFHSAGYRDGLIAGKEASAQEGFNIGFKQSVLAGYGWGVVRGVARLFHEDIKAQEALEQGEHIEVSCQTTGLQEQTSNGSHLTNYRGQLESLLRDSPAIDNHLPEPK
ncbi:Essential protein Yae1, N-terminal [Sesbania bispinosa]|nr:Essential protein Yae1, N-terminal [Sesbania bispinosa]